MWTQKEIETLKRLWPTQSGGEIASRLGKTRGSVLGKIHRLGLKKNGLVVTPVRQRTYLTRSKCCKAMIDLKPRECRYPVGEGRNMMFCGCKSMDGQPYCEEHYKITHRKSTWQGYDHKVY